MRVKIAADMSSTGREKWKWVEIDACIADLVQALQASGIITIGCCCGHGDEPGNILLHDGRVLLVMKAETGA